MNSWYTMSILRGIWHIGRFEREIYENACIFNATGIVGGISVGGIRMACSMATGTLQPWQLGDLGRRDNWRVMCHRRSAQHFASDVPVVKGEKIEKRECS